MLIDYSIIKTQFLKLIEQFKKLNAMEVKIFEIRARKDIHKRCCFK